MLTPSHENPNNYIGMSKGSGKLPLESAVKSNSNRSHGKFWTVCAYLILFLFLTLAYKYYLAPYWGYMGFLDRFNGAKFFLSTAIVVGLSYSVPPNFCVRSFFLNIFLTFYLIPSLVIYSYTDASSMALSVIMLAYTIVYFISGLNIPTFKLVNFPTKVLMWVLAVSTTWLLIFYYIFGGDRNFNLDISRVYEFRDSAADSVPGIFGYLMAIFSSTIIPTGVVLSLKHRMYIFTFIFFFLSVIFFGFTSHKSVLFYPFVITGFYVFLSRFDKYNVIVYALVLLVSIGILSELFDFSTFGREFIEWYKSLLIRRAIMIPPLLDYYYIDFFSFSNKYYWSSSFITFGLVPDYYAVAAPKIIGEVYFSDPNMGANTGFIGSGFSQAGIAGVIAYAVGVGLIFAIFQSYGRYLGESFVAAAMVGQVVTMVRVADFLTMFLTHGLLVSLLLLLVMSPPDGADQEPEARIPLSPVIR